MTVPAHAVLTGDIVKSSTAPPGVLAAVFDTLHQTADRIARWSGAEPRLTRFRGDGWQVVLPAPVALRAALGFSCALVARDLPRSRVAIGLGAVSLDGADLAGASGSAFERAGAALDTMARARRLSLAPEGSFDTAPAMVALTDAVLQKLSPAQATALLPMLSPDPPTQSDLAAKLGVTQQSISERLRAIPLWSIEAVLDTFEHHTSPQPCNSKNKAMDL